MPEYFVPVTGFSVNVTDVNKTNYTLTGMPALYHRGGRFSTVQYQKQSDISLSQTLLSSKITVHAGTDNKKLLRSAKLNNFQKVPRGTVTSKKERLNVLDDAFELQDVNYRSPSNKY